MSVAVIYAQLGNKQEAQATITETIDLFTTCAQTHSPACRDGLKTATYFKATIEAMPSTP